MIEIEASTKAALHSAVKRDGLTLKEWFLHQVNGYLRLSPTDNVQIAAEESGTYGGGSGAAAPSSQANTVGPEGKRRK